VLKLPVIPATDPMLTIEPPVIEHYLTSDPTEPPRSG
jgi:hypothetical protein